MPVEIVVTTPNGEYRKTVIAEWHPRIRKLFLRGFVLKLPATSNPQKEEKWVNPNHPAVLAELDTQFIPRIPRSRFIQTQHPPERQPQLPMFVGSPAIPHLFSHLKPTRRRTYQMSPQLGGPHYPLLSVIPESSPSEIVNSQNEFPEMAHCDPSHLVIPSSPSGELPEFSRDCDPSHLVIPASEMMNSNSQSEFPENRGAICDPSPLGIPNGEEEEDFTDSETMGGSMDENCNFYHPSMGQLPVSVPVPMLPNGQYYVWPPVAVSHQLPENRRAICDPSPPVIPESSPSEMMKVNVKFPENRSGAICNPSPLENRGPCPSSPMRSENLPVSSSAPSPTMATDAVSPTTTAIATKSTPLVNVDRLRNRLEKSMPPPPPPPVPPPSATKTQDTGSQKTPLSVCSGSLPQKKSDAFSPLLSTTSKSVTSEANIPPASESVHPLWGFQSSKTKNKKPDQFWTEEEAKQDPQWREVRYCAGCGEMGHLHYYCAVWRTQLCSRDANMKNMKESCAFGKNCKFAHGEHNLRRDCPTCGGPHVIGQHPPQRIQPYPYSVEEIQLIRRNGSNFRVPRLYAPS